MLRLDGRVALVTGAASGIGAATATLFAEAGADVALCWYAGDQHDVGPVAEAVAGFGRKALVLEGDVARTESVDRMVATTVAELGGLDIVVANAAIARDVPSHDLDDERWLSLLDVDLGGVFRCFRAALPHMVENGRGRLLATSSIAGALQGWPRHAHYTAAKAGVIGLVRSLALEYAARGITVNAVAPGVIVSPQTLDPVNSLGPAGLEEFARSVPVGRNGEPLEIANAFLFLASDRASYITGQTIVVDGGVTLSLI